MIEIFKSFLFEIEHIIRRESIEQAQLTSTCMHKWKKPIVRIELVVSHLDLSACGGITIDAADESENIPWALRISSFSDVQPVQKVLMHYRCAAVGGKVPCGFDDIFQHLSCNRAEVQKSFDLVPSILGSLKNRLSIREVQNNIRFTHS